MGLRWQSAPSLAAFLILVVMAVVIPRQATAVVVEHVFTGPITQTSVLFPQVMIGDPFTAVLRFDTSEVPAVIGSTAFYTNFAFELAVDGFVFPRSPNTALVVEDDEVFGDRSLSME